MNTKIDLNLLEQLTPKFQLHMIKWLDSARQRIKRDKELSLGEIKGRSTKAKMIISFSAMRVKNEWMTYIR